MHLDGSVRVLIGPDASIWVLMGPYKILYVPMDSKLS